MVALLLTMWEYYFVVSDISTFFSKSQIKWLKSESCISSNSKTVWTYLIYYESNDFYVTEQILHNIKQEYKRLQKRRHLDSAFQQADGCCPLDLQNIPSGSALSGSLDAPTLGFELRGGEYEN